MKLLKVFVYLFSINSLGQITSGSVDYGLVIDTFEALQNAKSVYYKNGYNKAIDNAKYLNFVLEFNKERSVFYLKEGMGLDNKGFFYAKIHSGYIGKVYQSLDFAYIFVNNEIGKFLLKKEMTKDWELVNDTKEISGFLCYKAIGEYVVNNGVGIFHHPVIAWYCPKIPNSYGPNGFGNLPGLILELQVKNVVFGVRKIELNSEKPFDVEKISNVKIIDENELNNLINDYRKKSKQE